MTWPKLKLETLAAQEPYSFVGGPFGSKLTSRDYVDRGVPVIRGSNMNNGRYIDMSDFVFVTESKVREDLSSNLAKSGDLVFTQRGTLGQVAIIPNDGIADRYVVSQSQMKLTVNDAMADGLFLYYFFTSREATERIMSFVSSSGVPHINLTVLRNFEVPVPPLEEQRGVTRVLSAYDDLIENNRRRIQLLEQAARLLYKEWFVHLRFPGHEHTKIKDGVPEGWERRNLGEVATILKGRNITNETIKEGDVPVVAGGLKPAYYHNEANTSGPVITVSASGANAGHVALYHKDIWASDCSYLSITDNPEIWFLYLVLKSRQSEITGLQQGAAQPHVYPKHLKRLGLLNPPGDLRKLFNETVEASFLQIAILEKQIEKLSRARDLLLPRLMNGEVAV